MEFIKQKTVQLLTIVLSCGLFYGPANASQLPSLWSDNPATPDTLVVPKQDMDKASFQYVTLSPVKFNSGQASLTFDGQRALEAAAKYLSEHGNIQRILIEGNTDYVGSRSYNDSLSDRRIKAVRNYLTLKGINADLIASQGRGEHTPVDQNWTREGRARNRNVAIHAVHWQR